MRTLTSPGAGVTAHELTAIEAAVRAAEPSFLADLERCVNTDCGSYTPEGVDAIGGFVTAFFERLGADVERRPDPAGRLGSTIVSTLRGAAGGPRVLLIGHMDTVFDPGTVAERPFRNDGGRITGPGVTDMKAGLLTGLYGIKTLLEMPGGLRFEKLVFVANPDEEIGSPSSTPHIRELTQDMDAAFVLECARANGDIVSSRKGILDARITIIGRAAHAGVEPEKGRNAILAASHLVVALQAMNGRWPGVTINAGLIRGGTRPNVVAERCELEIDVRGVTRQDLEAAEAAIRDLLAVPAVPDVTAELTEMARWWPMERLDRSGRLADHAVAIAGRLGFELKDAATGGASDANTTAGLGIPSLDGLGPIGGGDHSPAEYLEADSIVPRTALFAGLLLAVARDPQVLAWRSGRG